MNAEQFIERVRVAAAAGRQHPVALRDDIPANVGYYGAGDDLVGRLAAEIQAVGGYAQVVASSDEARGALTQLLSTYSARQALCWRHPLLDRLGLTSLLAERQIEGFDHDALVGMPADAQRSAGLSCDLGITSCRLAIAESGSLLMASSPGTERIASLLPPVHIAIVERAQIVPDLFDAFGQIQADASTGLPSNITLITGPSKTGDLELRLVTGVHGPGRWHVIIIAE